MCDANDLGALYRGNRKRSTTLLTNLNEKSVSIDSESIYSAKLVEEIHQKAYPGAFAVVFTADCLFLVVKNCRAVF